MYVFICHTSLGPGEWLTPYGRQFWALCQTRKPFTCVKSGWDWPAGTFAWRPLGNPKNRYERIAVDHSLDTRSIASVLVGHPEQARLVKALVQAEKPMPLHQLSHHARLDYRRVTWVLEALNREVIHVVSEWGSTADWWQGDGTKHESHIINFIEW